VPHHSGSPAWTTRRKMAAPACAKRRWRQLKRRRFIRWWGKARLHGMIANRPDWTLSRQRQWGVPMAFFVHKETGELHPRTPELLEQVAQRIEQHGIEAWQTLDPKELLGDEADLYLKTRIRWTSGSTPAPRIRPSSAVRTSRNCNSRPTCIWKVRTSIAAGSIRRC